MEKIIKNISAKEANSISLKNKDKIEIKYYNLEKDDIIIIMNEISKRCQEGEMYLVQPENTHWTSYINTLFETLGYTIGYHDIEENGITTKRNIIYWHNVGDEDKSEPFKSN